MTTPKEVDARPNENSSGGGVLSATPSTGRNASKVRLDMKVIPEASTYACPADIPVARYIGEHYDAICVIIEEAVHQKCKNEKMTFDTYEIWKIGSSSIIRLVRHYLFGVVVSCRHRTVLNRDVFLTVKIINFHKFSPIAPHIHTLMNSLNNYYCLIWC